MKARLDAEHNFMWLLGALVFLLFSDAMFAQVDSRAGQRFVNLTLMVTMVIAVWSVDTNKRRWLVFWRTPRPSPGCFTPPYWWRA